MLTDSENNAIAAKYNFQVGSPLPAPPLSDHRTDPEIFDLSGNSIKAGDLVVYGSTYGSSAAYLRRASVRKMDFVSWGDVGKIVSWEEVDQIIQSTGNFVLDPDSWINRVMGRGLYILEWIPLFNVRLDYLRQVRYGEVYEKGSGLVKCNKHTDKIFKI